MAYTNCDNSTKYSGRWYLEREAYKREIDYFGMTPEKAVEQMSSIYWNPWPKDKMLTWFKENRQVW